MGEGFALLTHLKHVRTSWQEPRQYGLGCRQNLTSRGCPPVPARSAAALHVYASPSASPYVLGPQRKAVAKGKSFQMRLEWLREKLQEQGDAFEEALAKDPLQGRQEIIEQEKLRAVPRRSLTPGGGNLNPHRFTVKEWQVRNWDKDMARSSSPERCTI